MEGDAVSGSAGVGLPRNSCLNALIVALNETCDGKSWYTSTKELQLASLEFCIACRAYQTLHLKVHKTIPRRLLASADAPPSHPKRLGRTRVPRLRARRVTWNMPTAAELRNPILAMMDVDYLKFGYAFEGSLEAVAWPRRLKTIEFHKYSSFNQPLERVQWPAFLQKISLGKRFNQQVERVEFPASLQLLRFGQVFNQPIAGMFLPTSLQQLELGEAFNQSIEDVKFPASLQQLELGEAFNQPIEDVEFPASLQQLIIGGHSWFDQPIAGAILPSALRVLALGQDFNHPIKDVAWPSSLQQLTFGQLFNMPIEEVVWPASLEELSFGAEFNQPIEGVSWPDSLQRLAFEHDFNQPVDNVRWPASLQGLTFGWWGGDGDGSTWMQSNFNQRIGMSAWPASLRRLTLGGKNFRQSLQGLGTWIPNLEIFHLLVWDANDAPNDSLLRGIEWPKGLRHLTVFQDSNLDGAVIPSTVEVLYAYNES